VYAPEHGEATTEQQGEAFVAAVLAAVEAFVGGRPHAVHRVDAVRFTEDVLEGNLDMIVDIVGVTIFKIWPVVTDLTTSFPETFANTLAQTHLLLSTLYDMRKSENM
jgi:hypothetical protein